MSLGIKKIKFIFSYNKLRKHANNAKNADDQVFKFIPLQTRNDYLVKQINRIFKSLKIKLIVKGYDNLGNGPAILIGNHQDNIDPLVVLYALKKQTEDKNENNKIATFIAKHTLEYKKSTRYPLDSINTFYLDRNDLRKSLQTYSEFGKFVKENKTFGVIFAEGTRNKEGDISPFKPGAFKIAKKELLPIVPFTINNSVRGFDSKRKKELIIEIIFHKKMSASSLITQNTIAISERVHNIVKSSFVKPKYEFVEYEEKDIETSKAAIKWHKKNQRKRMKEQKKKEKERKAEERILEAEEKEIKKFEQKQAKKESKKQKKEE